MHAARSPRRVDPTSRSIALALAAGVAVSLLAGLPARAQQPDLTVSFESATPTVSLSGPNSLITASVAVQNIGSGATPPGSRFRMRLYLGLYLLGCTTDLGTAGQVLVDTSLPAGGEVTSISILGSVPAGVTASGNYRLCVMVDSADNVTESNESNNTASRSLQVLECLADADCNDDHICTVDTCSSNTCSWAPVVCDDGDACTIDSCSPQLGCIHPPLTCDDGDPCTSTACDPAVGCALEPVVCDDEDPCTADSCVSVVGCVFTAIECPPPVSTSSPIGWLLLLVLIGGLGTVGALQTRRGPLARS